MVKTFFDETFVRGKDNVLNHVRSKKIKDKYLLTTDHGAWVALEKEEFDCLIKNELGDELFSLLEGKGVIITENNIERIMEYYRKRYDFLFKGVGLHIVVPTMRCNFKCIYCHSSSRKMKDERSDMDQETAKKILEFIFQCPSKNITIEFQGGEPLLNPEIFKYFVLEGKKMNEIYKKEVGFALVTNMALMTDELMEFIKKEGVKLCTSLDGDEELHDKNRTFEDGCPTYKKVTENMEMVKNKHNYDFGALQVTTRHTLNRWKELIDEYVKRGLSSIQIKFIDELGFSKKNWKECGYTIEEFIGEFQDCLMKDDNLNYNLAMENLNATYCSLIVEQKLSENCTNTIAPILDKKGMDNFIEGWLKKIKNISENKEICRKDHLNEIEMQFCMASGVITRENVENFKSVKESLYPYARLSSYFKTIKEGDSSVCENYAITSQSTEEEKTFLNWLLRGKGKEICNAVVENNENICYTEDIVNSKEIDYTCLAWVKEDESLCSGDYMACYYYFYI